MTNDQRPMTKTRNPVPDLMKGIAVLAMIQVHIMELFARTDIYESIAGKVSLFLGGPFAAPVFMAVMGYFIAGSTKGTWEKVKRGIQLIFLGLLLNIGLNFHLLIKIYNGNYDLNPLEYIFGADILFLAGLSIITISLLERLSGKRILPFIIISVLIAVVTPFIPELPEKWKYFQAFIYGNYSWSYFPLFPWLAYPLLGYCLARIQKDQPEVLRRYNKNEMPVMIMTGILIIALFVPAFKIITDLPSYYHHQALLFAWLVGFLIFYTWLVQKLEARFGDNPVIKYIKWLGKNVTLVYVVQWLIIGNIATAIYKSMEGWTLPLWFLAILGMTSFLSFMYLKLKKQRNSYE